MTSDTPSRPGGRTPGYGDKTPYNATPRIGAKEWGAGGDMMRTPRADDWQMSRNFEQYEPGS